MGIHTASYSLVRNGRHFIRLRVPSDLVARLERVEIVRALGTDDRRAARAVTSGIAFRLRDLWTMIRRQSAPTAAQLRKVADYWLRRAMREQWALLEGGMFAAGIAPEGLAEEQLRTFSAEMFGRDAEDLADAAMEEVEKKHFRRFDAEAGRLLQAAGFGERTGQRDRAVLAQLLLERFIDLQHAKVEWANGNAAAVPPQILEVELSAPAKAQAKPQVQKEDQDASAPRPASRSVKAAINIFLDRMRQNGARPKQILEARSDLNVLVEGFGEDFPVGAITRSEAGRVREALRSLPSRFRAHEQLDGLVFFEKAAKARELGLAPLGFRTVNSYLVTFRNLLEQEKNAGQCTVNPFVDMREKKPRNFKEQERTLTAHEVETIFDSPLFQGAKGPNRPYDPGEHSINSWMFWAPLIAFLTGARIGEIAQLRPCDIRIVGGLAVLDINDHNGKTLKNPGTARLIPLHSKLLELGLLRLAEERKARGAPLLLPDMPQPVNGDPGKAPGQWMSERFLRRLGLKNRRGLGFHSFRHTLKTLLRDAGVQDSVSNEICGHDSRSVGHMYGKVTLEALQSAVESIKLPAAIGRLSRQRGVMSSASSQLRMITLGGSPEQKA